MDNYGTHKVMILARHPRYQVHSRPAGVG
jgi:hypothetical protein